MREKILHFIYRGELEGENWETPGEMTSNDKLMTNMTLDIYRGEMKKE